MEGGGVPGVLGGGAGRKMMDFELLMSAGSVSAPAGGDAWNPVGSTGEGEVAGSAVALVCRTQFKASAR